jgi:hypothetical protein
MTFIPGGKRTGTINFSEHESLLNDGFFHTIEILRRESTFLLASMPHSCPYSPILSLTKTLHILCEQYLENKVVEWNSGVRDGENRKRNEESLGSSKLIGAIP